VLPEAGQHRTSSEGAMECVLRVEPHRGRGERSPVCKITGRPDPHRQSRGDSRYRAGRDVAPCRDGFIPSRNDALGIVCDPSMTT
jgi:hypothetical protein